MSGIICETTQSAPPATSAIAPINKPIPAPRAAITIGNATAYGSAEAMPPINPLMPLPAPFPSLPNARPIPPNIPPAFLSSAGSTPPVPGGPAPTGAIASAILLK